MFIYDKKNGNKVPVSPSCNHSLCKCIVGSMCPHMVYVQYNYRDEIPVHVCVRDRHFDSDAMFSFFSKLGKEVLLLLPFGLCLCLFFLFAKLDSCFQH